jgi:transposase-like protein
LELQQLNLESDISEKVLSGGKKYCSSCTSYQPDIGGEMLVVGSRHRPIRRWKCAQCLAKISKAKYSSKRRNE